MNNLLNGSSQQEFPRSELSISAYLDYDLGMMEF
jgi:hypothetical protein